MFRKILVANRGEIAIRAFRAAYELGARTVAVYPFEDRGSIHRQKADESYVIGEPGHPVRAYLDVDEIIRVALASGADAIYPGYGFLSENPELAARAAENGITFIGPPSRASVPHTVHSRNVAPKCTTPQPANAPPATPPRSPAPVRSGKIRRARWLSHASRAAIQNWDKRSSAWLPVHT